MRDDAARALHTDEPDLAGRERAPLRHVTAPTYEPPRRREAPPRAYGSRRAGQPPTRMRAAGGVPGRRTVEIRGQVSAPPRRRSTTATAIAGKPDRIALYAFLFALFLVLMAVATAHS